MSILKAYRKLIGNDSYNRLLTACNPKDDGLVIIAQLTQNGDYFLYYEDDLRYLSEEKRGMWIRVVISPLGVTNVGVDISDPYLDKHEVSIVCKFLNQFIKIKQNR